MRDLAILLIHLIVTTLRMLGPGGLRSVAAESLLLIVLKPATILAFHRALVRRKYRLLFTPKRRGKPGPKGPSPELAAAIVEMKRRNPRFGCRRIAEQISFIFSVQIDKDIVRRVLAKHYRPEPSAGGP